MASIAYVDHSYHRTTGSTGFLRSILRARGHEIVDFWDDAWQGGAPVSWAQVQPYDIVIMFQSYCLPEGRAFRQVHPNVIYIPMLDQFGIWQGPTFNQAPFWEPFQGSKVLNFSSALHCLTTGFGIASHWARFFQPVRSERFEEPKGLRGFFWLRREDQINWRVIRSLIAGTKFESFHVHLAPDPGSPAPELPTAEDIVRHNITTSTWFADRSEFSALMDQANVFFAPRMEEGIGQSFLEAMARGACVVAPNQGTMNEYILHGINGLLFDRHAPHALDFSEVRRLGAQARASVLAGYAQWRAAENDIVNFILTPSEVLYKGKYQHAFVSAMTVTEVPSATKPSARLCFRALSKQYAVFRMTRPVWHPIIRFARQLLHFRHRL